MSAPEPEEVEAGDELTVIGQITVTYGIDSDGDACTYIQSTVGSLIEALGMLEVAKAFVTAEAAEE